MLTEEELHHTLSRREAAQRRPQSLPHHTAHHTPKKQSHKSLTLSQLYAGAGAHNSNISTMYQNYSHTLTRARRFTRPLSYKPSARLIVVVR